MIWRGQRLFVIFVLCVAGQVFAQEGSPAFLSLPVRDRVFREEDLGLILQQIAHDNDLAISFEPLNFDPRAKESAPQVIELKGLTLREAFGKLVNVYPEYAWKFKDGMVIFSPRTDLDPVTSQVLETRIANALIEKRSSSMSVGSYLVETRELSSKLLSLGISDIHFNHSIAGLEIDDRANFVFVFQDKTVRQILNEIVKETKSKYWSVIRWGKNGEYITIVVKGSPAKRPVYFEPLDVDQ